MSATTIVDLAGAAGVFTSIAPAVGVGGTPASGVIVGMVANMRDVNNLTNVLVSCGPSLSGSFRVQVQTSDATTSGSFTDPTSGLAAMPTNLLSGGILLVNSGGSLVSGGIHIGGFLRPHQYARALVMSGDQHNGPVGVTFLGQQKRTGSGPGYTFSPASGTVNV